MPAADLIKTWGVLTAIVAVGFVVTYQEHNRPPRDTTLLAVAAALLIPLFV